MKALVWIEDSIIGTRIPGTTKGMLRRYRTTVPYVSGPVWLNYHDRCCEDSPQRVWQLHCDSLCIRNVRIKIKDVNEVKIEAQKIIVARLREIIKELEEGENAST